MIDAASHKIALPGSSDWAAWRWVCLRGASFPLLEVLRIASQSAAAAADRLRAAEDEATARREEILSGLRRALAEAPKERLDSLTRALRLLKRGGLPDRSDLPPATHEAAERFATARERAAVVEREYLETFASEEARLTGELRDIAGDARFREAILWQNRQALKTAVDKVLSHPAGESRRSKDRQHEQVVASYLQRFCTKNDTIGFFGPVGWARLREDREELTVRPGPDLLAQRRLFFEGWCIDAIADRLAEEPSVRPWLAPRCLAFVRPEGTAVLDAFRQPVELASGQRAVLAACDGETTARELARRLSGELAELADEAAVLAWLDELQTRGLIAWGFHLPIELEPERTLRRQLERIGDAEARALALGVLDEMEAARDQVAAAAGDIEALDAALAELDLRFTRRTGKPPIRAHGQTYAGRTLVYEDCRRDVEVEVGAGVLSALAPPLSLLLASARWFSWMTAQRHAGIFRQCFEELRHQTGAPRVDLLAFCQRVMPTLLSVKTSVVRRELAPLLEQRWEEILAIPAGERRVCLQSDDLRPRVREAFAAPRPAWSQSRHHSPDVLIAATGPEAIGRGDFLFVLGELHLAVNTLGTALFVGQHPEPQELLDAVVRDLPQPCVIPVLPKLWKQAQENEILGFAPPGTTARLDFGLVAAKDLRLELSGDPSGTPQARSVRIGDFLVEAEDEELFVVSRDGRTRCPILDFLQMAMTAQTVGAFRLLGSRPHRPRVTIDRLVVARESWRAPVDAMGFARAPTEAGRFAGTRRWAAAQEMPRFLFVRTPTERKPFYLDLDSPVSVEIFAREVRRTHEKSAGRASIALSEMLPGPHEAWLPDAQGRRYTSELRLVLLDEAG